MSEFCIHTCNMLHVHDIKSENYENSDDLDARSLAFDTMSKSRVSSNVYIYHLSVLMYCC